MNIWVSFKSISSMMTGTTCGYIGSCVLGTLHSWCSLLFIQYSEWLETRRPGPGPGSVLAGCMALEIKECMDQRNSILRYWNFLVQSKVLSTGGSNPFINQSLKQRSQFLEAWVQATDSTQLLQSSFWNSLHQQRSVLEGTDFPWLSSVLGTCSERDSGLHLGAAETQSAPAHTLGCPELVLAALWMETP